MPSNQRHILPHRIAGKMQIIVMIPLVMLLSACGTASSSKQIFSPAYLSAKKQIEDMLEGSTAGMKYVIASHAAPEGQPFYWLLNKPPAGTPVESEIITYHYSYSGVHVNGGDLHLLETCILENVDPEGRKAPTKGTTHYRTVVPIKSLNALNIKIHPEKDSDSIEHLTRLWSVHVGTKAGRSTSKMTYDDGRTIKFPFLIVRFQTEAKARAFVDALRSLMLAMANS